VFQSKIGVHNDGGNTRPREVYVEPWGEDYTLLPGESLEIIAFGPEVTPGFDIVEFDGATAVYCNNTSTFEVRQGDRKLECGHRRGET